MIAATTPPPTVWDVCTWAVLFVAWIGAVVTNPPSGRQFRDHVHKTEAHSHGGLHTHRRVFPGENP